jgi:asparagine synthase (glutamine-hydrolysing)
VHDIASVNDIADVYLMFRRSLQDRDMRVLGFDADELDLTSNFHDLPVKHSTRVAGDPIASVGRLETTFYLGNTLLRDGDVFGMANSLEIRVPFLDRDVIDWAFKLPGSALLPKNGKPKHLLRKMCAEFLGPDQLDRPKRGFGLPIASWIKGPLKDLKEESFAAVIASGLVTEEGMRSVEKHYGGDRYRSAWTREWTIVALGQWLTRSPIRLSL